MSARSAATTSPATPAAFARNVVRRSRKSPRSSRDSTPARHHCDRRANAANDGGYPLLASRGDICRVARAARVGALFLPEANRFSFHSGLEQVGHAGIRPGLLLLWP